MTPADSFDVALALTAACAVLALLARALTLGGAIAGAVIGGCVSVGFGLPGLAVLGTFFVVGTLATRVGWKTKNARGTAEAGEGRRDWKRVVGKGGVAAVVALLHARFGFRELINADMPWFTQYWIAFVGALAAATADTLGTEFGTLSNAEPRSIPLLRKVPAGTPGAVSLLGLGAAALGAIAVAWFGAWPLRVLAPALEAPANPLLTIDPDPTPLSSRLVLWACGIGAIAAAAFVASLIESLAVGLGLRAPGFVRNLLTTAAGAVLAALCASPQRLLFW